jgi:hypothetical protein
MQQEHWQITQKRDALAREFESRRKKEDELRKRAMDPNKSKSMSEEEKRLALNSANLRGARY